MQFVLPMSPVKYVTHLSDSTPRNAKPKGEIANLHFGLANRNMRLSS
jgi:hypothetical protein